MQLYLVVYVVTNDGVIQMHRKLMQNNMKTLHYGTICTRMSDS